MRIYTNGAAIHRIAVFYGGAAVQGLRAASSSGSTTRSTTHLSPETMIAIAKSLVPARRAPA